MDVKEITDLGIEGAFIILICVISYKIYKMKSTCDSSCFKKDDNGIDIHTENNGGDASV